MNGQHETIILISRVLVLFFGTALFLFGVVDLVIPRARFVSSSPPAGSSVADPPAAVTIKFSSKLSPESRIDVVSTIRLSPSGENDYLDGSSVVTKAGLDPSDASGRSLRADLRPGLHKGLYFVNWRTKSAGWRAVTFGKTPFGVGMPVPEYITQDMGGSVWERHYQQRSRRGALIGGALMLALGLLLPLFKRGHDE